MSKELVFKEIDSNGYKEVRLSHRNLADHLGLRQGDARDLIEKHIASFEQISPCPFETEMVEIGLGAKREVKVYYLDSDQANFLIGLTRPTEDTLGPKLNVVMRFKEAKKKLSNLIPINQESINAHSKMEIALHQANTEIDLKSSLWKKLGMKKVDRDAEALEALRSIEHEHMVTGIVPISLANRVAKLDPSAKKVVETALSGKHVRPIRLAGLLGWPENTMNAAKINKALCEMGLQMRHVSNNNAFMPIGAGVNIANVDDVGTHKGVLVGWEPIRTVQALEEHFSKKAALVMHKKP